MKIHYVVPVILIGLISQRLTSQNAPSSPPRPFPQVQRPLLHPDRIALPDELVKRASERMMAMPNIAPLFLEGQGFKSTIAIVNPIKRSEVVDIIVRDETGQAAGKRSVSIAGLSSARIAVSDLVDNNHDLRRGSILMEPRDEAGMTLAAQLSITYTHASDVSNVDEEFAMPSHHSSTIRRGVSLPFGGDALIAIASVSEAPQSITVRCISKGGSASRHLRLGANQSWIGLPCESATPRGLDFLAGTQAVPQAEPVGVEVSSDGHPGSFEAFGVSIKTNGIESLVNGMPFSDPAHLRTGSTVFAGVNSHDLDGLSPSAPSVLTVANFSEKKTFVKIDYFAEDASSPHADANRLAEFEVSPGSVRTYKFPRKAKAGNFFGSVVATSTGLPGDVQFDIGLRTRPRGGVWSIEPRDGLTMENGGKHPWQVGSSVDDTVLVLFNNDESAQDFPVRISDSHLIWNKVFKLGPKSTAKISIRDLRDNRIPDDKGLTLSKTSSFGSITWRAVRGGTGKGRLVEISDGGRVQRSFSCLGVESLCPGFAWMYNYDLTIDVGGSDYFGPAVGEACQSGDPYDHSCGVFDMGDYYYNVSTSWTGCNHASGCVNGNNPIYVTGSSPGVDTIDAYLVDYMNYQCVAYAEGTVTVRPKISGNHDVWYFGGQTPSGFATSLTLTSSSSGTWSVTSGSNKINLSTTSGSSTTITASGTYFSTSAGDISVVLTVNGVASEAFTISARTPYYLDKTSEYTNESGEYAYETLISYQIKDNLDEAMDTVPINESFPGSIIVDYTGTNWQRGSAGSFTATSGAFADDVSGMSLSNSPTGGWNPDPHWDPTDTLKVHHFAQEWRVGSLTIGSGQEVQTDDIQRYQGRATHTNIVTPVL